MPGQQGFGRDNRSHLSQKPTAQSFGLGGQSAALVIVEAQSPLPQLFAQHSVLFPKVVDQLRLLLVHAAGHRHQQEPERVQGFRHEERNIIIGSPAVHGPVGDPLQIYADRVSGHEWIGVGDLACAQVLSSIRAIREYSKLQ